MAIVTLRYWAAAKDAAGAAEDKVEAQTLAAALGEGVAAARERSSDRGERLERVMTRSSYLIDGLPAGTRPAELIRLADDSVIEVLPPFAGG